jgi:hypothetical protein
LLLWLALIALIAAAWIFGRNYVRDHPQDVPWTPLRLDDPIGFFTSRKLARLADDPALCRRLLEDAGANDVPVPPRRPQPGCGYDDGMQLQPGPDDARLVPADVVTSCPVAAALLVWERQVLQPAAQRQFGSRVRAISHAGSYSCRRLYGRGEGPFSEHATADAIDLTGFTLADGTRISVLRDWPDATAKAGLLRDARDGACRLFATALSPDYNAAHADHLHFDMAGRGTSGFSVCR